VVKSARSMNRWELTDHIDRNASAIVKEGKVNQTALRTFLQPEAIGLDYASCSPELRMESVEALKASQQDFFVAEPRDSRNYQEPGFFSGRVLLT